MGDFGITNAGFVLKTFDDILSELNETAQLPEYFGADIDLSEYGEVGIFNQLFAKALTDTWEDLEDLYYSMFIDTAEGVSLDRVVALGGLSRREASKADVVISISGTNTTLVPEGFIVQTANALQFGTIEDVTIAASGCTVTARALVAGLSGITAANTITEIVNPLAGVDNVNNNSASTGGKEIESDSDLRYRYKNRNSTGTSSVNAILAALYENENITIAKVNENDTDGVVDGLPAHSVQVIVGGTATSTEIAEAIFSAKPAGIATYGSVSVNVADASGDIHTINYDVVTDVFINVIVEITSDSEWVSTNETLIKTAVVKAIGGVDTIDTISTEYSGMEIGEDVRVWKIIAEFDDITGIDDTPVIKIAFSPTTPTASTKLAIAEDEKARCDTANVTVTVS